MKHVLTLASAIIGSLILSGPGCASHNPLLRHDHREHVIVRSATPGHGPIVRSASDCPVTPIRRTFRSRVILECPATEEAILSKHAK